jgi:hypothetical protein
MKNLNAEYFLEVNFDAKPKKLSRAMKEIKKVESFVDHLGLPKYFAKLLRDCCGVRSVQDYKLVEEDLLNAAQDKIKTGFVQSQSQMLDLRDPRWRLELLGNAAVQFKYFEFTFADKKKLLRAPSMVDNYLASLPEEEPEPKTNSQEATATSKVDALAAKSKVVTRSIVTRLNGYMKTTTAQHTWQESEVKSVFDDEGKLLHAVVQCYLCDVKKTVSLNSKNSVSIWNYTNHNQSPLIHQLNLFFQLAQGSKIDWRRLNDL